MRRWRLCSLGHAGWARGSAGGPGGLALARERAHAALRHGERRSALRKLGYPEVETILWDVGQGVRGPGVRPRSIPELLPQGALVFGRRGDRAPSILDAVLEDAGAAAGRRLTPVRLSARGGVMLAFCDRALVRVAVGPGRALDGDAAAHARTRCGRRIRRTTVARLVPWTVARAGRDSPDGTWSR